MQWFHVHDCNMDIVRGADWCKSTPPRWTDRKCYGRNVFGPTLREAYDRFVQSGRAADMDGKKEHYLGWVRVTGEESS